ncbi:MAG: hypothetical protein VXX10_02855 [Pseudomonadota bacterium]|nr:hypothetical protein [Pseudomonadota bacterium]MEC8804337.1 hypothetical protein [Pseudomonadota bacterium]
MKLRQIAAAIMLLYAVASFAAESPLEQAEENSDALVSDEIESAEASDSATAAAMTEPSDEEESPGRFVPTEQISQDLGVSFPVDI